MSIATFAMLEGASISRRGFWAVGELLMIGEFRTSARVWVVDTSKVASSDEVFISAVISKYLYWFHADDGLFTDVVFD
jgi:hypothetical protein